MTTLLEQAVQKIASLPEPEQDALASLILSEINSDRRWDELFASSEDMLANMAADALREDRQGATQELNPDRDFAAH